MEDLLWWARSILSTTPARWESMAQTFPAELLARKPAPTEWSALECLQHIIDVEAMYQFRVRAFLDGRDFPAFDPDREGTPLEAAPRPSDLAAKFAHLREESLSSLAALTPADLERKSRHAELGPVTLREMVNAWVAHDLNHTVQAERAMMQPFIRDCGPWQGYFTDHLVRAE